MLMDRKPIRSVRRLHDGADLLFGTELSRLRAVKAVDLIAWRDDTRLKGLIYTSLFVLTLPCGLSFDATYDRGRLSRVVVRDALLPRWYQPNKQRTTRLDERAVDVVAATLPQRVRRMPSEWDENPVKVRVRGVLAFPAGAAKRTWIDVYRPDGPPPDDLKQVLGDGDGPIAYCYDVQGRDADMTHPTSLLHAGCWLNSNGFTNSLQYMGNDVVLTDPMSMVQAEHWRKRYGPQRGPRGSRLRWMQPPDWIVESRVRPLWAFATLIAASRLDARDDGWVRLLAAH